MNKAVLSKADGLLYRSTRVAAIAWVGQVERECARHSWRGSCAIEDGSTELLGACGRGRRRIITPLGLSGTREILLINYIRYACPQLRTLFSL